MPMNFPDMESLKRHAKMLKFRQPEQEETEADYREALADHVKPIDQIESMEIRTKKGWDKWSDKQNMDAIIDRAGAGPVMDLLFGTGGGKLQ